MSSSRSPPAFKRLGSSAPHAPLALEILFAASGCAALIYEVVWFQLLTLAIGAAAPSLGVLLAMFLGGLCIGSLLVRRFVSRRHNPLRVYAAIELAVGVLGFVALYEIPALGSAYAATSGSVSLDLALRSLVAAVALLPPTILIGATLPAVVAWLEATPRGSARVGLLYAANVGGAALGSVLAGFYLLRAYDTRVATLVAVAINVAVSAAAFALAPRVAPAATAGTLQYARAAAPRAIYVTTALSGATALSAEVLWTRHLSLLIGSTVYTLALILAALLAGLGLGGFAGAELGRRIDPRGALACCQLALCAALAWGAYFIACSLPHWPIDVTLPTSPTSALALDVVRIALAVVPGALLWGASFPLALAAAAHDGRDPRRVVGGLYAANTAGAIAGALLTTFLFVPGIGSLDTQKLMILTAACAGVLALSTIPARVPVRRWSAAAAAVVAALLLARSVPDLPPALVAYGRFLPTRGANANVVYVGEGLTASIAVTQEPSGILTYHNAGKTQASTYPQDLRLQRMLGHLSTLVPEHPASVLVIGLGAGITAGAVSLDPEVERVVVAEIEPLVPTTAAQYFSEPNFGVVENPKVDIVVDDGRHHLATTREKFDAITSDPLDPWVKGAAALYTREFWQLCKAHLNDGGVVTVFLQLYETTDDAVKSEIATFLEAFPNGAVFANEVEGMGYDAVLLGRAGDAPIDAASLQDRLGSARYENVARSLRAVGFDSALDLLATFAAQATDMSEWLRGAAINTDANLRLQYLAAEGLNERRAAEIFNELLGSGPRFPERLFAGTPAQLEELRQRLQAKRGDY
jgi:spermidine synthase